MDFNDSGPPQSRAYVILRIWCFSIHSVYISLVLGGIIFSKIFQRNIFSCASSSPLHSFCRQINGRVMSWKALNNTITHVHQRTGQANNEKSIKDSRGCVRERSWMDDADGFKRESKKRKIRK